MRIPNDPCLPVSVRHIIVFAPDIDGLRLVPSFRQVGQREVREIIGLVSAHLQLSRLQTGQFHGHLRIQTWAAQQLHVQECRDRSVAL